MSELWSLRSKLLAAFVLVIVVALGAAGAGVAYLVLSYQRQLAVDQVRALAVVMAGTAARLEALGVGPAALAAALEADAQALGVRALVIDAQAVVLAEAAADASEGSLRGQRLDVPGWAARPGGADGSLPASESEELPRELSAPGPGAFLGRWLREPVHTVVWEAQTSPLGRTFLFVTLPPGQPTARRLDGRPSGAGDPGAEGQAAQLPRRPEFPSAQPPAYRLVLAVPVQNLASAWFELAPSLALAALAALTASVGVALWLSRSIARPVREMTRAAEAISRGDYRVAVPGTGRDEVGQLARAFNRMAQEVRQSQSTLRAFVANASHELRTPLTSIQGFAQAIAEGTVAGEQPVAEAVGIVYEEAERMQRLVEDLLYLSRIESGQLPVEARPVDLAALLQMQVRRFAPAAGAGGMGLRLALPPASAPVTGDPHQLERLFSNLLQNAIKYTPEGGTVTVTLGTLSGRVGGWELGTGATQGRGGAGARGPRDKAGGRRRKAEGSDVALPLPSAFRLLPPELQSPITVSVHNTGSYIPPEHLPHIFERFYRVDTARVRDIDGRGLGLAIAHEIATAHGGTITASSDPAAGTTFTVTLPVARVGAAETGSREPIRPKVTAGTDPSAARADWGEHRGAAKLPADGGGEADTWKPRPTASSRSQT